MKAETVAESFDTYRAKVLPADASDVQVVECRRAFYAGAYFMLMNGLYNVGDEATSEEDGIAVLEELKAECETFAAAGGMPALRLPEQPDISYTTSDAEHIKPVLQELGTAISARLPTGWGFNLLLFSYGPGSLFYISSAERADVIALMKEFIRKQVS